MFNLGSSYFHVALTTVRHLLTGSTQRPAALRTNRLSPQTNTEARNVPVAGRGAAIQRRAAIVVARATHVVVVVVDL